MMMKKFVALMMVLCLVCGAVALAEDYTLNKDNTSCGTTVSYTIAANETYTVMIPASVELQLVTLAGGGNGLTGTLDVKLGAPDFNVNKIIKVFVKSGNKGKLIAEGVQEGIPYFMALNDLSNILNLEEEQLILSCDRTEANTNPTLSLLINAEEKVWFAGEYTDTLQFRVALEDVQPVTPDPGVVDGSVD